MLSLNLKIFLIVVEVIFLLVILINIRNKRLLLKYSLLWLVAIAMMICVVIFPQLLFYIRIFLGMEVVSNLVFMLGWLTLLVLTFALTIIVSEQKKKITLLIEEVGILDNKIKELKNDKEDNK